MNSIWRKRNAFYKMEALVQKQHLLRIGENSTYLCGGQAGPQVFEKYNVMQVCILSTKSIEITIKTKHMLSEPLSQVPTSISS